MVATGYALQRKGMEPKRGVQQSNGTEGTERHGKGSAPPGSAERGKAIAKRIYTTRRTATQRAGFIGTR